MSSRRKFFLIFCFILLDMFLLIGFLVIRDATFLNDLKNEVKELSKLDITKDRYNREIKSRGSYAIVESAIKEYLDNYAVSLQEISKIMNDEKFTKILSYDNYKNDGSNFYESLNYLATTKKNFNKKINELIDNLNEDKVNDYINDKIIDPYYINLYKELMSTESMVNDFKKTKEVLEKIKISVNNTIDVSVEVLNFLKINKDSWNLEDGEIKFLTVDLYNYYNNLISKITTKKTNENENLANVINPV